ncbi:MAG: hypothetical protein FWE14_03025 [Lachnospiraceae bacterium]|nr:hypothetical protein [Lachnospiraceae bacterium]
MNKGGIGVGSASILLVFAVLSLTIFSVITLQTAMTDKKMTDVWKQAVIAYYEADTLAESIVSEILAQDDIPYFINGVNIEVEAFGEVFSFSLPVSEQKELHVRIAVSDDFYEALEWKIRDTGDWVVFDEGFDLWPGF